MRIVQAEVTGQGPIAGVEFGHSWAESEGKVYDFQLGKRTIIDKEMYYRIGKIQRDDPSKYRSYTVEQARQKLLKTKQYGPWDVDVEL